MKSKENLFVTVYNIVCNKSSAIITLLVLIAVYHPDNSYGNAKDQRVSYIHIYLDLSFIIYSLTIDRHVLQAVSLAVKNVAG